ncbi:unnamed protein product, partial [Rotaria magnacalcarata]
LLPIIPDDGICASTTWNTTGVIVAGAHGAGAVYVADTWNDRIVKWTPRASIGKVVAGGDGEGNANNQLNLAGENGQGSDMNKLLEPAHIFVDENQSVFAIDFQSAKVMQWPVGSKEGILVAGGNWEGDVTNQLNGIKYSTMM